MSNTLKERILASGDTPRAVVAKALGTSPDYVTQVRIRSDAERDAYYRGANAAREAKWREERTGPNVGKEWTDEELDRALKMVAEGKSLNQVGAALGRPRAAVAGKLHRQRHKGWKPKEIADLKRLVLTGKRPIDIAPIIGRSRQAVTQMAFKLARSGKLREGK